MGATIILASYLLVFFVIGPILGILTDWARALAGNWDDSGAIHNGWDSPISMNYPADLDGRNFPSLEGMNLKPMEELREETANQSEILAKQRERPGRKDPVFDFLEEIVPEWLHRNDPKKGGGKILRPEKVVRNQDGNPEEGIDAIGVDDDVEMKNGDDEISEPVDGSSESENAAHAKKVKLDVSPKRVKPYTLQNMDELLPSSSCPANLSINDISTTLVTQCSLNRIDLLVETCNRWEGPIVLVLYLANENEEMAWAGKASLWGAMCPQMRIIPHLAERIERDAGGYPVNKLRNIGLDAVQTSHVFVMDADFVPSVDLHATIGDAIRARDERKQSEGDAPKNQEERNALIVPAFERKSPDPCDSIERCRKYIKEDSNFIPMSIAGLRECVEDKNCIVFQSDMNWEGHHSTHSERWIKGDWYDDDNDYDSRNGEGNKVDLGRNIKSISCFDSVRYEPWVVLRWCPSMSPGESAGAIRPVAPYFDERFHGYGKNKIEMIAQLRFMGFTFSILPLSFIVHQPHPESKAKKVWMDMDEDLHHTMDALYPKFLRELANKYDGGKNAIPTCREMKNAK